jgi:glycine cleavage system H protein
MSKTLFSQEHEWLRDEGDGTATIGITDYAQQQLGDLVFIGLPEVGKNLTKGDEAAAVESVKSASDIYLPVSGTVVEINAAVVENPEKVNTDPLGDGWFFKIKIRDPGELAELMDEAAYTKFIASLG